MMKTLNEYAERIEARLKMLFPEADPSAAPIYGEIPGELAASMRYSVLTGGKRLRPAMMLACAECLGSEADTVLDYACAVEMIHTYSLIHDDLPGMDNDTLRRGKPTNHVVFGVGQAILAGDGLLNLAYEFMLAGALQDASRLPRKLKAMREIATGAGVRGMIAGQVIDLLSEQGNAMGENELDYIQRNKTARMFSHSLRAAAILSLASEQTVAAFGDFGMAFGLLFQATDDLLDVLGEVQEVGKTLGKDAESGKLTCVSLYGVEGAKRKAAQWAQEALEALSRVPADTSFFRRLTEDTLKRTH